MTLQAGPSQVSSRASQSSSPHTGVQPPDLWQRALATLDDDFKAKLDFKNSTKRDILEKTLKTAEEKKQICLKRRWKFKVNGKDVIVRDVLEKVIRWLDHFKAIGDIAIQYDQAHAALPWAGVRFLLKPIDDARLKITVRMLKSTMASFQTDEDQQLQQIASQDAKISTMAVLSDAETLNLIGDLKQPFHRIADQAAEYAEALEHTRYRRILDWLSPIPYIEHQQRHSQHRLQGSGEWLLNKDEYLAWQSSSTSAIFHLHGMAGSGKSTLTSAIVDYTLRRSSSQAYPALLAYVYCSKNASELARSDPQEIMRSIVRQLGVASGARKTIHRAIVNEYEQRETEAQNQGFDVARLSLQDCIKLILHITESDPATIVLDALDEVRPNSRYGLLESLQQIVRDSVNVVKILATSRDDDQILSLLTNATKMRVEAEYNRADVERFVHDQVNLAIKHRRLLGGHVSSKLRADLSKALMDAAGEIFQLVIWQMEKLCNMQHESDVQEAMRRFSTDTLDQLYSEILQAVNKAESSSRKTVIYAFSLLLCLHEPLSPASFLAAVSFADGKDRAVLQLPQLLRICFNLITVDTKMNVLRFAHTTVQEYLEAQDDFPLTMTEGIVATSCLNSYLYTPAVGTGAGLSPTEYFHQYGALYWAEHCRAIFATGNDSELLQMVRDFMLEDEGISLSFTGWLEDAQEYAKVLPRHHPMKKQLSAVGSQDQTLLFTLCVFGLANLLRQVLDAFTLDLNVKNDSGQTGIYLASSMGHLEVARILLQHGANVNVSGGRLGTPLQAACFEGHIGIVQLLIMNGADTKSRGLFHNALQAAAKGNHENIAMLLLQSGFEIKSQSEYDQALEEASQTGFIKVVDYLQKTYGYTFGNARLAECQAIHAAIRKGQIGVLQRFIRSTASPKAELPADSVATAALGGHDGMIALLLDNGLSIEYEGQFGTPLRSASLLGYDSTVRLLLNHAAKGSTSSSIGNALEAATMNGYCSIVKLLLQEGVDANIKGGSYGTALQAAAYRGHTKVAEILLDAGANVRSAGICEDAFHAAAEGGHEEVMRLFLERGFRFRDPFPCLQAFHGAKEFKEFRDILRSSSPDHWAQKNGHSRNRQDIGVDAFSDSRRNMDVIVKEHYAYEEAASREHLRVLETMLDNQVGRRVLSKEIRKFLYEAARNGREKVVECFLSKELNLIPYLQEALHAAATEGHLRTVDMLTTYYRSSLRIHKYGAETIAETWIQIKDNVLFPGCRGDHIPIIARALDLLKQCHSTADMHTIHKTILHEACKYNSDKALAFVLTVAIFDNADVCKAIDLSCEYGSIKTLSTLLSKYMHDKPRSGAYRSKWILRNVHLPNGQFQGDWHLVDETLNYGLYIAAFKGHLEVFKILVQKGASMDTCFEAAHAFLGAEGWYSEKMSVTGRAARETIALLLLNHRASCNLSTPYLDDLLKFAIRYSSSEFVLSVIGMGVPLMSSYSGRILALKTAAGRESGAATVMEALLQAGVYHVDIGPFQISSPDISDLRPVLHTALDFFYERRSEDNSLRDGRLYQSNSIDDMLYFGPGAVVRQLLQVMPTEKAKDDRFGLLFQMVVAVDDRVWTNFLIEREVNVNRQGSYYGTALQCAARLGHLELVQLLLVSGAEVNIIKGEHGTALRAAVLGGHQQVVDVLLQNGADINLYPSSAQRDRHPGTESIIQLALETRNLGILRSLVAAGANLNTGSSDGFPLLIRACEIDDPAIVRFFLDQKLEASPSAKASCTDHRDPDKTILHGVGSRGNPVSLGCSDQCYRDERGSVIHPASSQGHENIARTLIECEGYSSKTPLQVATSSGHLSIVRLLINTGVTIDFSNSHGTALSIASRQNRLEVVKELLLAGATIFDSAGRWNALAEACRSRSHAVVELLLDELPEMLEERACAGAFPAAIQAADDSIFQMLLSYRMPVSPLIVSKACAASFVGSLSMLLERGIDIDEDNGECGPALHTAAYCQQKAAVDILLDNGANVNTLSPAYGSSLQAALEGLARGAGLGLPPEFATCQMSINHPNHGGFFFARPNSSDLATCEHIVRALLQRGADPNTPERSFGNPLHLACFLGNVPTAQQLLGYGADLHSLSDRFGTALFAALEPMNEKVVDVLVQAGINVNQISSKHGTALHYVCSKQSTRLVRLLLDNGADPNAKWGSHGSPLTASIPDRVLSHRLDNDKRQSKTTVAIVELLLRSRNRIEISEEDFLKAVKTIDSSPHWHIGSIPYDYGEDYAKLSYGEQVVRLFLEHDKTLQATEPILLAAIKGLNRPDGADTLQLILQRAGETGITEAMFAAARDEYIMEMLRNHRPILPVTS
ncbi:MAG: hypothetical protein Q9184_005493 [Pyrenodesmia sp. 2 TL-2023]